MDDEISDGDLVRLAGADDPVAFRLLVERYRPAALARALRLCGDLDDVEDIVQDALLQAFVALDRLQDPERFAAWLGGIVLMVALYAIGPQHFIAACEQFVADSMAWLITSSAALGLNRSSCDGC